MILNSHIKGEISPFSDCYFKNSQKISFPGRYSHHLYINTFYEHCSLMHTHYLHTIWLLFLVLSPKKLCIYFLDLLAYRYMKESKNTSHLHYQLAVPTYVNLYTSKNLVKTLFFVKYKVSSSFIFTLVT